MKRLSFLISLLVTLPLLAGSSPLRGIRSIYLVTPTMEERRDVLAALKKDLPQVEVLSTHRENADAVLEITRERLSTGRTVGPMTPQVAVAEQRAYATLTRDGKAYVLDQGNPSRSFARLFAEKFVAGWKEANR